GFFYARDHKKPIGIAWQPSCASQNVVRRIARMGSPGDLFQNSLDVVSRPVAHPGLDAVNYGVEFRRDLTASTNQAFDRICQSIPLFLVKALPCWACLS